MNLYERIRNYAHWKVIAKFALYLLKRINKEQIHVVAGYLSYVTLMSLVPLMVVMLSVMTAFPIFSDIKEVVENFVYNNFVPTSGDVVQHHLTGFVNNASKMSAIAVSFLFLFALLLISAIDKTFNRIWNVNKPRRVVTSFSMYWMVLTLGPILAGGSIVVTSYIASLVPIGGGNGQDGTNILLSLLPILASVGAFLVLYMVVPNKTVIFKYAISGAVTAAILFEFAKKGFAFYVTQLPSYQAIYGALGTIPILFLWVYLSWLVTLIGAVLTVALQDFSDEQKTVKNNTNEVSHV